MGTEILPEVAARVRDISLELPEATVRTRDDDRQFSEVRGRWFCILSGLGSAASMIVAVDPGEREMLVASGHPFVAGQLNANRVGVIIDDQTDWTEIKELITDSYRIIAPKRLSAELPDA